MDRLRPLPLLLAYVDFTLMLGLELAFAIPALLHLPATDWPLNILPDGRGWLLLPLPFCWLAMAVWPAAGAKGHLARHLRALALYALTIIGFFAAIRLSVPWGEGVKMACPLIYVAGTALALLHLGQGFPALRHYLSRSPS